MWGQRPHQQRKLSGVLGKQCFDEKLLPILQWTAWCAATFHQINKHLFNMWSRCIFEISIGLPIAIFIKKLCKEVAALGVRVVTFFTAQWVEVYFRSIKQDFVINQSIPETNRYCLHHFGK